MNALEVAREYLERGWQPVAIRRGEKRPIAKAWQTIEMSQETVGQHFNGQPLNIGVRLGEPSGGLCDVDLDTPEAEELAPHLLPDTGAIFGRASSPQSHYLYLAGGSSVIRFTSPPGDDGKTKVLVELRGNGGQTVFPGSEHPSGEIIEWHSAGRPAAVGIDTLRRCVSHLAAGALLMRLGWAVESALLAVAKGEGLDRAPPVVKKWLGADQRQPELATRRNSHTDFSEAARAFNDDHPIDWGAPGAGKCPICEHSKCFGRLPQRPERWCCFSASHGDIGVMGNGNRHGDALDVEAFRSGKQRAQLLKDTGYLRSRHDEQPPPPPQDDDPGGGGGYGGDERPAIYAGDADLAEVIDDTWDAVIRANDPPTLFRRGRDIVSVGETDDGTPMIYSPGPYGMRERMARDAAWFRVRKIDGESCRVPSKAPLDVALVCCASVPVRLPPLHRIIRCPIVTPSGRVVDVEGYDREIRAWYAPGELRTRSVPDSPSRDEISEARQWLEHELLGDFPFVSAPDRANTMAALLLPFAREIIDGPTPLHLFEKPSPGSGASLLVEACSRVACGGPPGFMSEAGDEEEWRKRLTSTLMDAREIVVIDNLRGTLDSAAVSKALTDRLWADRKLGASANVYLPIRCAWFATGNNPSVSNEIARRTVSIRIDPKCDRPWEREPSAFRHPSLLEWVAENRAELVYSTLVLIRAWFAAGRPSGSESIGSFERWASVMGGILGVSGIKGFLLNRRRFYDRADQESAGWQVFVEAWHETYGGGSVGVKELWGLIADNEAPCDLGRGNERSQRTRFGRALRTMIDRRYSVGGIMFQIVDAGTYQRSAQYRLEVEDGGQESIPF